MIPPLSIHEKINNREAEARDVHHWTVERRRVRRAYDSCGLYRDSDTFYYAVLFCEARLRNAYQSLHNTIRGHNNKADKNYYWSHSLGIHQGRISGDGD